MQNLHHGQRKGPLLAGQTSMPSSLCSTPSSLAFASCTPLFNSQTHLQHTALVKPCSPTPCVPSRHCRLISISASATPSAAPPPPPPPPAPPPTEPDIIPGTPCFTRNIMATPMPQTHREIYFSRAAAALQTHLVEGTLPSLSQITLLPPQLNPEFDVYDRRYLLQLTWALLSVPASAGLRTRVLIQGARKFGAIPLSIAGLRRTLDADLALSRDEWPPDCIRTGDLEAMEDIADDDDLFLVLSPTNAVSIPVVDSLRELAVQARGRPIISLNPRLADVPSHGGVMQVAGRAERMNFLDHFEHIFYLRLLFTSGTNYPVRGILFREDSDMWQVWRAVDNGATYRSILTMEKRPSAEEITTAFAADRYTQQKKLLAEAHEDSSATSIDALLTSSTGLIAIAIVLLIAIVFHQRFSIV